MDGRLLRLRRRALPPGSDSTEKGVWRAVHQCARCGIVKEIAKNVWRPDATPGAHTFLIYTQGHWALIDAGFPWEAKKLLQEVRAMTDRLDGILLTHHDVDHIGGLDLLQRKLGAPVYVHPLDRPFFDGAKKEPAKKNAMNKAAGLIIRTPSDMRPLDEQPFTEMEAVWMPGHTPGHSIFRLNDLVFVGDMFKNEAGSGPENLWEYHGDLQRTAESLRQLASMRDVTWLPAHGEPLRATNETGALLVRLAEAMERT